MAAHGALVARALQAAPEMAAPAVQQVEVLLISWQVRVITAVVAMAEMAMVALWLGATPGVGKDKAQAIVAARGQLTEEERKSRA